MEVIPVCENLRLTIDLDQVYNSEEFHTVVVPLYAAVFNNVVELVETSGYITSDNVLSSLVELKLVDVLLVKERESSSSLFQ